MRSYSEKMLTLITVALFMASALMAGAYIHKTLYYHRTTFNQTSWFTTFHNVTLNTTLKKMYLQGGVIDAYVPEILTDYTEVDGLNAITRTNTSHVSYANADWRANVNSWLVKSKPGELQACSFRFKINVDTLVSNTAQWRATVLGFYNYLEDSRHAVSNSYQWFGVYMWSISSTTTWGLSVVEISGGAVVDAPGTPQLLQVDKNYWLEFNKKGSLCYLEVYSDKFSTLLYNISNTLAGDWNMNYLFFGQNVGYPTGLNSKFFLSQLSQLKQVAGIKPRGVAYTKNLLENYTYPEIAFSTMVNVTKSPQCSVTIFISPDNVTWNNAIQIDESGHYWRKLEPLNLSDLYFRFNWTSNGVGNVEIFDFWYTNLANVTAPPSPPPGRDPLLGLLMAVVAFIIGAGWSAIERG